MLKRPAVPQLVLEATHILNVHPYKVTSDQARAACEDGSITQDQYDALYDFIEARDNLN
jgi:hypothetical protein